MNKRKAKIIYFRLIIFELLSSIHLTSGLRVFNSCFFLCRVECNLQTPQCAEEGVYQMSQRYANKRGILQKVYRHKKEQNKITLGVTPSASPLQNAKFSQGEDRFCSTNEHTLFLLSMKRCVWTRFGTLRNL